MTTSTPTRRDNLHTVYMYIVKNWAVDVNDMATGLVHLDAEYAEKVKVLTKDEIHSLLSTLERKGLVVGEQVNGVGLKVWQSYFDVENEKDAVANAEAEFAAKFPNEVKAGKTPTPVEKNAPSDGDIVYEVNKTRHTGAHTYVTFLGKQVNGDRWTVTCDTHNTIHRVPRRMLAEHLCHRPEEWCADCQVIDTTNQHEALQEQGI